MTRLAYLNARMRARKARLLGRSDVIRLAAADTVASIVPGWRDLGAEDNGEAVVTVVYRRLVGEYAVALRTAPGARPALLALVRLHEIENVKLVWRALVRARRASDWRSLWRPVEPLATVPRDACRELTTVRSFVALLDGTPYEEVADATARAHAADVEAAELAFDRWSASQLEEAIAQLPRRERAAGTLLQLVADERNAATRTRPTRGPAVGHAVVVQDFSPAVSALRIRRRTLARRALQGTPYCLAPLFAYLLAREDEARALLSLAEARARRLDPASIDRVLATVM